ncbi:uncharacterized protein LOC113845876 [Abrus precatorius]|uniref:Uncharacterized protein LOC113845876 n=1 Tax=Abrus precatorius TaxID=3816 RepID=A0A8B8JDR1_ABRPR|nr:uncharacterized protein LOC113845876 [Abrus precatorius]
MKKRYHKGTVHPSPPLISDHLSFLPATILTLTVALSPEDKEVLAYLISCSATPSSNFSGNPRRSTAVETDHPPLFSCSCFCCYTSYWVRWDESPNRQLIHEIIDAFEEWLANKGGKNGKGKKEKRNKKGCSKLSSELKRSELTSSASNESGEMESVEESSGNGDGSEGGDEVGNDEKGSVRRLVSFIGEKIWGGWGHSE